MTSAARHGMAGILLFIGLLATESPAADWPNWRGPNFDGISGEKGFKTAWSGDLPKLWAQTIGEGFSGVSVVGDRLYTCGTRNELQTLACLHIADGRVLWESPVEKRFNCQWGAGSRATPTVRNGRVYILGARGTLACFDALNGERLWSVAFRNQPPWGYAGSVLVGQGMAVAIAGGKTGAIRAYEQDSGRLIWQAGGDTNTGYSSPYPFQFQGRHYICAFLGKRAIIVEWDTGREVLRIPWKTDWNVNAATPIFQNDHLWLGSGYRTGSAVFKISKHGDALRAEPIWKSRTFLARFQTPVLYKGRLYGFDDRALTCVDFMTGERLWRRHGKNGATLLADGYLLALSELGRLMVGKASPDGFKPTGVAALIEDRCWTVPTLVDGRLYVRSMGKLLCFDMRRERRAEPAGRNSSPNHEAQGRMSLTHERISAPPIRCRESAS